MKWYDYLMYGYTVLTSMLFALLLFIGTFIILVE